MFRELFIALLSLAVFLPAGAAAQKAQQSEPTSVSVVDREFRYGRHRRVVPLRIYVPDEGTRLPVVLFSHGLGGSNRGNRYLGDHWAANGYVVVMLQHAGSDNRILNANSGPLRKTLALRAAMKSENALHRFRDVSATIDRLIELNKKDDELRQRMDTNRIGMSGHSFGAITTQVVSGQSYRDEGPVYTDKRIDAAIAFSPSPPSVGYSKATFGGVSIPWLLMTGTNDNIRLGRSLDSASRRNVFRDLPRRGHFYELVLDGAEHHAFTDNTSGVLARSVQRNPNHHKVILRVSTEFWDAYLKGSGTSKAWLNGPELKPILHANDVWQTK